MTNQKWSYTTLTNTTGNSLVWRVNKIHTSMNRCTQITRIKCNIKVEHFTFLQKELHFLYLNYT
jgi:hypothetical protein